MLKTVTPKKLPPIHVINARETHKEIVRSFKANLSVMRNHNNALRFTARQFNITERTLRGHLEKDQQGIK